MTAPVLPPLGLSLCVGTSLNLASLTGPTGSLSALNGLTNVFGLGSLPGNILSGPISVSAGVNLFNVTSTSPLGCTTNAPISVTGVPAPVLPPLGLSLCVGTSLNLASLTGPTGSLSALNGLTNVFGLGSLPGNILSGPISVSAGVNLFNVTSTSPLGCTTNAPISVTGVPAPVLPPLGLSLCVGTSLNLASLTGAGGSLSALNGLTNVFGLGSLPGNILSGPISVSAGVNLFNVTSTSPLGCTTNAPISVTGVPAPVLPPLGLSLCVGANLDLASLTGAGGSLSALNGLTNVFGLGSLPGNILSGPISVSAGVNLFNVTSTSPLGCTTNAPISVTGVPAPVLPPLGLSLCVGTSLNLASLTGPTGSLSALNGLTNVFGLGSLPGNILSGPISVSAGVNLFNITSTSPLGCTTNAPISVTGVPAPVLPPLGLSLCVGTSLNLASLTGPTGSLSALNGLTNVFGLGSLPGNILSGPISVSAGVNLFNVTSTSPLGCTTNAPISVTGVPAPVLPPLGLSLCVGTSLNLASLTGAGGSLSALNGLTNVFGLGSLPGNILNGPISVSAGVNLFNVTSTSPLGCTTNAPISVTGVPAPVLPPLGLSLCVGANLDLASLTGAGGSLSALNGLTNVFGLGSLPGNILSGPISVSAGVNLFNVTSTSPLGCTTNAPISVTGVPAPVLPPLGLSLCVGTSLNLASLTGAGGSLSALNGLTNVFGLGSLPGNILSGPISVSAGVNLFNVTSTSPLGCTTNAPISVTGVPAPVLPPLGLSLCVGTSLNLASLTGAGGSLSALNGLTNVFGLGSLPGNILSGPISVSAGVNLFNVTSTSPLGCTTNAPISVTGVPAPVLPPLGLSLCVGTSLNLASLTGAGGSLSALNGLTNVFGLGSLPGNILNGPISVSAGVNLFNVTSTSPLGCTTNAPISVTGVPAPVLPPLGLSLCVGTSLNLASLTGAGGSLSALNGLTNVFGLGSLPGNILSGPISVSAGVNLFNVTSTSPLGCTTNAPISVTGVPAPVLPPLGLSLCVGTSLNLASLTGAGGSLSALNGLTNVFGLGSLPGNILSGPISVSAGVNLFNVTSTSPLGCTTNAPISVTGVPAPVLPPLGLSLCVGANLDLASLTGAGGSLSALNGLTNVFGLGSLPGNILSGPISVSAGVNLFNVTSTSPLGCTTNAPISVTGVPAPVLPPLGLSLCVGANLDLASLTGPTGSLSALNGLTNVFGLGGLPGNILSGPISVSAGVNLFNVTSTSPLGCTTNAPISVTGVPAPVLPPLGLSLCVGANLDLASLTGAGGSLSALNGLTNVFGLGSLPGNILSGPISVSAGVNLFNVTSTSPLGCTTNAPISVTGVPAPVLPPLGLSLCVGANLDLASLTGPTGSLSALNGLTNVFGLGGLPGNILSGPISVSAGVNLFNVTSTSPLGCTTNAPISVTGVPAPVLPPLGLSLCVGTSLNLASLTGPTGSLSALNGLTNVFGLGGLPGNILNGPISVSAGVNLFNVTSTSPLGCTTNAPISVTGVPAPVLPPLGLSLCVGANLDLASLTGAGGSLSALNGLTNVFGLGSLPGNILSGPISVSAGVNLFNVTSTSPLGCTTNAPISVTGVPAPVLPPLGLSLCVGANLDLASLTGAGGSLSALNGLTNVFGLGSLPGNILSGPISVSAGVNLFNVTSTSPLGCTTNAPISVTGVPAPVLPPLGLSLCVGANLDLASLTGPTGSLSALNGLTNVFGLGGLPGNILSGPISVSAGVNLFNVTSTSPLGCTTNAPISVTGVPAPVLPPLGLSLCVGTSLNLASLTGPTGSLSALNGLTNVFGLGGLPGNILNGPISVSAGVNLFNVTSTSPLGCTTNAPISVTGVPAPVLPPLGLSLCVGANLDLASLTGAGGSLSALNGLTNVFGLGSLPGNILSGPISVSAGVNLFNVTSTSPLGCTTNAPISVTGVPAPVLPPLGLSLCVGANLDLASLTGAGGSLSALNGLTNVFGLGGLPGNILSGPISVSAGVNLFNVTSTSPLGCTTNAPISVTGVPAPVLPPISLSLCVGANLDLTSLSGLTGLTNVFRTGDLLGLGTILGTPTSVSVGVGVNLFNVTSTSPLGCTAATPISVTGVAAPVLNPISLSLCVGANLDLTSLSGLTGLTNVFRTGNLLGLGVLIDNPVSVSVGVGVNLFNVVSTNPLGCTTATTISVTGVPGPVLPPVSISLCATVGVPVNLSTVLGNAANLSGLTTIFRDATGLIITNPIAVSLSAGVNLFTAISTNTTGCTAATPISVTLNVAPVVSINGGVSSQTICEGTSPQPIVATVISGTVTASQFFGPLASTTAALGVSIGTSLTLTPTSNQLPAPGQTAFFALVVNGATGCADTTFVAVTVNPLPTVATTSVSICLGESVDLSARVTAQVGTRTAFFTTLADAQAQLNPLTNLIVAPTLTTTFFARVSLPLTGCFVIASIDVSVNAKPNAGVDQVLSCTGVNPVTSTTLTATPAGGVFSNLPGNPTGAAFVLNGATTTVSNLTVGSYSFVYSLNGCQDTVNVVVQPCVAQPVGSIGGLVFNDLNKNGQRDAGDPGVDGVTVRLLQQTAPNLLQQAALNTFTVISTTVTMGGGQYLFSNLPAGTYVVEFVQSTLPVNFTFTTANAPGVPDNLNSDADPATGRSGPITIVPTDPAQRDRLAIDAGIFSTDCPPAKCLPITIRRIR